MIKIAICDNNPTVLAQLDKMIREICPKENHIFSFSDASSLIDHIEDYSDEEFDIVITDIRMPNQNGIEMAKKLKQYHPRIQLIFITAYAEYIQDVFSVNPIYFIMKPINVEKLSEALNKAIYEAEVSSHRTLDIISQNKALRIRHDEIKYIESRMRTVTVHELRRNTEFNMKLDELENKLPSSFIRCHKSYLVNMNTVRSISNNRLELFTGETIPIAKAKYPKIKQKILQYFGELL